MKWNYNDGGRSKYYKATNVRDCVTRAIAIANNLDYQHVYKTLYQLCKLSNSNDTPRSGIHKSIYGKYLNQLGWVCINCDNTKTYVNDIRYNKVICKVRHHLCAIIDGVLEDT